MSVTELKTKSFDANVTMEGTLTVDGATTLTGELTATGGLAALKLTSGPTGTVGAVWTTAPPAFSTFQKYVTMTAGATVYRVPVFDNA